MDLNKTYEQYTADQSEDNRTHLWVEVRKFILAAITKKYGTKAHLYEDAGSEALVAVFENEKYFDPKMSLFTTWVTNITYNKCIDEYRKMTGRAEVSLAVVDIEKSHDPYVTHDKRIMLRQFLSSLNPERQQLITLKLAGYGDSEIASRLGKTVRWVTNNYLRSVEDMTKKAGKSRP